MASHPAALLSNDSVSSTDILPTMQRGTGYAQGHNGGSQEPEATTPPVLIDISTRHHTQSMSILSCQHANGASNHPRPRICPAWGAWSVRPANQQDRAGGAGQSLPKAWH